MRLGHRGLVASGAVLVMAGSALSLGTANVARADSTPIGFSTPTIMSPIESVGEPTIVVSPAKDATVYASGPWGSGTQRSLWYASQDGGQSFRLVQQCPPQSGQVSAACPPPTAVTGTANPPGGGDTDQRVDSSGQDYFADLWALACDRVATTTDHGATATQNAVGCTKNGSGTGGNQTVGADDRQWLTVFDPGLAPQGQSSVTAPDKAQKVIYMEYNDVASISNGSGNCTWEKSTDGINYTAADGGNAHYGCDGYPSIDQVSGDVFEASNGQLNIGVPNDAQGDLTFLDDSPNNGISTGLISYTAGLPAGVSESDTLFTGSYVDSGRNLHIVFTGSDNNIYTTVASYKTSWTQFAAPVRVSAAPSDMNVFPWIVAGGPGRSDSVWYGTDNTGDPSSNLGQQWYVYMAQTVWPTDSDGAVTLQPPTTTMVQVSPHPAHYNSICLAGTGCIASQGDRNLADFFTVAIDHSGAAEVEYDDTTNGLEEPGFTPTNGYADHAGAPVVTIARQDSGPGLFGTDVGLRPNEPSAAPVSGRGGNAGDALYPVIGGTNVPFLDLTGNQLALSSDGKSLTVTMDVQDLSVAALSNAATAVTGSAFFQYVTRWVMCPADSNTEQNTCTIYYAEAEVPANGGGVNSTFQYSAGPAQSIDLCSVSACDPHAEYYPEATASGVPAGNVMGNPENGSITCPATPSAATPCTISITVNTADIGAPTSSSLLEEVGSYSFGSARPQAAITFPDAEADQMPLEVDGVCCFNFQADNLAANVPEVPFAPALIVAGALLVAVGLVRRRRARGVTA